MSRATISRALVVGLPPVLLAGFGCIHPAGLDAASAHRWHDLHVILLPIFPLLGFGPWMYARSFARPLFAITLAALGFIYGAFYSALDVLAGIGAGRLQMLGISSPIAPLFAEGDTLALVGTLAYLMATLLAASAATVRARWAAVPGALLVIVGALSFLNSHIFWPRGVFTMLALSIEWVALVFTTARSRRSSSNPHD